MSCFHNSRRDAHKVLMRCLDGSNLDAESPRSDAELLWHFDITSRVLTVRHHEKATFTKPKGTTELASQQFTAPTGALSAHVLVARQYSPSVPRNLELEEFMKSQGFAIKRPRSRLTPVPVSNLENWARQVFQRQGLTITDLSVTQTDSIYLSRIRKKESIPTASIVLTAEGENNTLSTLLRTGIGRGRNYGLGLIRPL
ncbi:type I-E CRISPR-associated protein Cas6/Cse3/CasE [Corynebacterium felinum]|uniref:CRISPR associated protein n=1 Tax=Corynebacterium felinum TaxID=131318 RepID=A0ABU2BA50_9CORY|nr:type I-E CRISPR-associated protein Cas6/Cse3/CasE [Corynebacterium felinum]MDF5820705.1 type I-E CRISPR-associated protein Cas6/Cse3/CasE [Corynebacterium felinum]MDR7355520.1 hypothetical protein [Corynebacterium felinum]